MFFNGGYSLKSPQAANVFGLDGGQTAPLIEPGGPSSAVALRLSACPPVRLSACPSVRLSVCLSEALSGLALERKLLTDRLST